MTVLIATSPGSRAAAARGSCRDDRARGARVYHRVVGTGAVAPPATLTGSGEPVYRTAVRVGEAVPAELLAAEVQGPGGARRLDEHLRGPSLVLFLRHFG
jgi:hypothetical protein